MRGVSINMVNSSDFYDINFDESGDGSVTIRSNTFVFYDHNFFMIGYAKKEIVKGYTRERKSAIFLLKSTKLSLQVVKPLG